MITAIKNKLAEMNGREMNLCGGIGGGGVRFGWSCNKGCSWIAIELLSQKNR